MGRLWAGDGGRRYLAYSKAQVPVNRSADVVSVLGIADAIQITDTGATAVVRSWERRFGALRAR